MSKQEEARLILELYDLRREDTMRKARDWYFREFNPQSLAEFTNEMFGAHSGYLRMVVTYWDMAAAMVNNGAISVELFRIAIRNISRYSPKWSHCSVRSGGLMGQGLLQISRS